MAGFCAQMVKARGGRWERTGGRGGSRRRSGVCAELSSQGREECIGGGGGDREASTGSASADGVEVRAAIMACARPNGDGAVGPPWLASSEGRGWKMGGDKRGRGPPTPGRLPVGRAAGFRPNRLSGPSCREFL